jgi:hypothetical protein
VLVLVLFPIIVAIGSLFIKPPRSVHLTIQPVTNAFGVPLPQLTITNPLGTGIFVIVRNEAFGASWSDIDGLRTAVVSPRSAWRETTSHPVASGKWRFRVEWSAPPPVHTRPYQVITRVSPRLADWLFHRRHVIHSEPIEAWQPAEQRK